MSPDANLQKDLARVRSLAFPYAHNAKDVTWHSSVWRWIESHPLASEMYRWVIIEEDRVVGHLAAIPQYYRINGQRVVAHTPADYMVISGYGFHALLLMREFFRTCQNCVACDLVPAAIKVETRLGAEVAGKLRYAAKVLDVSRMPLLPTSTPAPILRLLNWGLRVVDKALVSGFGGDLKVESLESFDESFDELFEKIAAVVPCLLEKDSSFLRWRYGPGSPTAPVAILGVRGKKGLLGYAVLRVSSDGRDGYILDVTAVPGRHDVAQALLQETVRHFRRAGVSVIAYWFLESPTSPQWEDLRRLSFFSREEGRYTLLTKFADRGLQEMANDAANWSYSTGDGEASFWVG